jgi:hypothetical protein
MYQVRLRQTLSLILTLGMLPCCVKADTPAVNAQIAGMALGTNIELRLKNKEKLRGARGTASDTGFTLVNPTAGDRQIAFNDVASVKPYIIKTHTSRNILIGVGIALFVALGIIGSHV